MAGFFLSAVQFYAQGCSKSIFFIYYLFVFIPFHLKHNWGGEAIDKHCIILTGIYFSKISP